MIEFGNPVMEGKPPIETEEDLEGIEIPDPLKDGLYPGYIWSYRELRRIFTKYKISHALWGSLCVGPVLMPMMAMLGMEKFSINLRKKPELVKRCCEIATKWLIRYGKAFYRCLPTRSDIHMRAVGQLPVGRQRMDRRLLPTAWGNLEPVRKRNTGKAYPPELWPRLYDRCAEGLSDHVGAWWIRTGRGTL